MVIAFFSAASSILSIPEIKLNEDNTQNVVCLLAAFSEERVKCFPWDQPQCYELNT